MTAAAWRVQLEPAYLLHHYPWRDSSRILELLTQRHGRVTLFARAARRGGSALPAVLQPFGELLVSWSGRGEAGQLTGAERPAPARPLAGDRLMSAFYASELVIKLLPRHDPHPAVYGAYAELIGLLADASAVTARGLRLFEKRLLEELGWGLSLEVEAATGRPIDASRSYRYRIDGGAEPVDGVAEGSLVFSGTSLLSLANDELGDARSLADARRLLAAALERCLEGRPLKTREVFVAMRSHGGRTEGA